VVVIVALAEMVLRLAEVIYAPFYALFLVGPAALLVELVVTAPMDMRRGVQAPSS
jgi:hypothetical protein